MNKKIFIPYGIKEDIQIALLQGIPFNHFGRENRYQNIKIIKELKLEIENEVEIKTDYVEENLKTCQFRCYFRIGERIFTLVEDYQIDSTSLYAKDDYGDKIGVLSLRGRPLNLEGIFDDALDFQEAFDDYYKSKKV